MTRPTDIRRERRYDGMNEYLRTALDLAASGLPPLPLRAGIVPFGNCRRCANNACGGRLNMKRRAPSRAAPAAARPRTARRRPARPGLRVRAALNTNTNRSPHR